MEGKIQKMPKNFFKNFIVPKRSLGHTDPIDIPPARLKNARRVKLRETMDIPQPDANLAPITYRYIKNMLLYQNHFR